MQRIMLSAAVAVLFAVGCGSDDTTATPDCKGLVNLTLTLPGSNGDLATLNANKTLELTGIDPAGTRWMQTETPPLVNTSVALRAPSSGLTSGSYQFRGVAAAKSPSGSTAASPIEVKLVGRVSMQSSGSACLSATLPLTPPSRMDLCMDLCDSEVRCGKRGVEQLTACQSSCSQSASDFTEQQQDWVKAWTEFYKGQANTSDADAATKANTKVQSLIGQYEGCNFAACGVVEDCGAGVLAVLGNPQ